MNHESIQRSHVYSVLQSLSCDEFSAPGITGSEVFACVDPFCQSFEIS